MIVLRWQDVREMSAVIKLFGCLHADRSICQLVFLPIIPFNLFYAGILITLEESCGGICL